MKPKPKQSELPDPSKREDVGKEERPIKANPTGNYNLDFIDWQNEFDAVYEPTKRPLKPLIMTTKKEEMLKFDSISTEYLEDENVETYKTTYEQFQEGSRQNRFDCVISLHLYEQYYKADIVEKFYGILNTYYEHYAKAPIFIWILLRVKDNGHE